MAMDDALAARWRRLDKCIADVHAAVASQNEHGVPDAVAATLDALYDLWELWQKRASLTLRAADESVGNDDNGRTAAALVHARGAKSHAFVEFGDFTDTYAETYFDHYGAWRWQTYHDLNPRYSTRDDWYARHVAGREVLPPLESAVRWLRGRPELQ